MFNVENRTKSHIIYSFGILIYSNKSCHLGSQSGSHFYCSMLSYQVFIWDALESSTDRDTNQISLNKDVKQI